MIFAFQGIVATTLARSGQN